MSVGEFRWMKKITTDHSTNIMNLLSTNYKYWYKYKWNFDDARLKRRLKVTTLLKPVLYYTKVTISKGQLLTDTFLIDK